MKGICPPLVSLIYNFKIWKQTLGTNIINIEPEFTFLESLCPSKSRPEYKNRLGSSKSRLAAEQEEAKVTVQTMVETYELNDIVGFIDGSCLGNPGSCGSGACIFIPNKAESIG